MGSQLYFFFFFIHMLLLNILKFSLVKDGNLDSFFFSFALLWIKWFPSRVFGEWSLLKPSHYAVRKHKQPQIDITSNTLVPARISCSCVSWITLQMIPETDAEFPFKVFKFSKHGAIEATQSSVLFPKSWPTELWPW